MFRKFYILNKYVYLDNASALPKPKSVLKAINFILKKMPFNAHSSDSVQGIWVNNIIEETRLKTANLINADKEEIIFTNSTTDSLNKIALMLQDNVPKNKNEILLSPFNHSSNLVPFLNLAKIKNMTIKYTVDFENDINDKTFIVSYAQMNNTLMVNLNYEKIYSKAKKYQVIVINDCAQAISHEKVDFSFCDVIAFSGNKLYAPTGIGILAIKKNLLNYLQPSTFGGGSVAKINKDNWINKTTIEKYEPGTPNVMGIYGLNKAIDFFTKQLDYKSKEKTISLYAFNELKKMNDYIIFSKPGDIIIIFNHKKINAQDIVSYLGHKKIILRAGEHCVKFKNDFVEYNSSIRLSISKFNNKRDIDKLIKALKKGGDFLGFI